MSNNIRNYINDVTSKSYKFFDDWNKREIIWLISAVIIVSIAAFIGWDSGEYLTSFIAAIGSIMGTICVILVSKKRISNFIFGFLNVACFGIIYLVIGMYGMAAVNLFYFIPMQLIGFNYWLSKKQSIDTIKVKWASWKLRISYIILTIIGTIIIFKLVEYIPELFTIYQMNLPVATCLLRFMDSFGTIGNILAQLLMTFAVIDQWIFWFLINISQLIAFGFIIFVEGNIYYLSIFIMYLIWTINSIWGFLYWVKNKY